ncbi:MAG: formylglycine-generating enzyme family protein, partial [bacterium]|nr:formylglycine-generating enzyme family protein [bacterium]
MPKNENAFGFLRLPTEVEWEFAARGGSVVDATHFDKKHPYPGPLTKYEWYEGPKSSHSKIKKIGILKPNDLKIHDMLGNVSEMTSSFYRVEYYQGRMGGFVSRGGNYFTSKNKIRSSMREEIPFYKNISGDINPARQKTLGLR